MTEKQAEYLLKLIELLEQKRQEGYRKVDEKIMQIYESKLKELIIPSRNTTLLNVKQS